MTTRYAVGRVLARRDRVAAVMREAAGAVFDQTRLGAVADAVAAALPARCDPAAVFRSIAHLGGQPTTSPAVRLAAWAMAGRVEDLRAGRPAVPDDWPQEAARVPVQVVDACKRPSRSGAPRYGLVLRVLAGPGTPGTLTVWWSQKFAWYFAGREVGGLGFTIKRPNARLTHPNQLVGCRMYASVKVGQLGPEAGAYECPPAMLAHNTALIEMRARRGFACPFQFDHHCHACPKGAADCPAAVRRLPLVAIKICPECDAPGFADPAWPGACCVACQEKGLR